MSKSESRNPASLQFGFLNQLRRERKLVNVYLMSGVRLQGLIRSFDTHSLLLETRSEQVLLSHDAISTVGAAAAGAARASGARGASARGPGGPRGSGPGGPRPGGGFRGGPGGPAGPGGPGGPGGPPRDGEPKPPSVTVRRRRTIAS
ncbi:MAG TPA: RNA chaperone Hfq [Burkholderiaceae bacterium]|nr:RNA chaperone Hfq [Burkholderiaceae bacterium]